MARWAFSLLIFFAFTGHSSALYCVCKDLGNNHQALQKAIDYACGNGADCGPIQQNGACYVPNTVQDHCHYAVNSFYQRNVNSGATCDFGGAATTTSTPPAHAPECVFPSSSSNAGTCTTTPSRGGTPGTPPSTTTRPPSTTTPPFFPGAGNGTGNVTPGTPHVFGISPKSSTGSIDYGAAAVAGLEGSYIKLIVPLVLTTLCLALRV